MMGGRLAAPRVKGKASYSWLPPVCCCRCWCCSATMLHRDLCCRDRWRGRMGCVVPGRPALFLQVPSTLSFIYIYVRKYVRLRRFASLFLPKPVALSSHFNVTAPILLFNKIRALFWTYTHSEIDNSLRVLENQATSKKLQQQQRPLVQKLYLKKIEKKTELFLKWHSFFLGIVSKKCRC